MWRKKSGIEGKNEEMMSERKQIQIMQSLTGCCKNFRFSLGDFEQRNN